ncbi:bacteriorhodopsin [Plantactinospora sp. GCM10030261]|uniref:bacteriorhodopsin n=1 Tax=Plantactinospora sp. GCM10030261 TaxID=3273420 RepID=UPI0036166BB0
MTGAWLWGYVSAMAAGALLFLRWSASPKGVPAVEYRVAIAVPVWSGLWYAVMALGGGQVDGDGHPVYWARYVDWSVSASLLLTALALTATHALPHRHPRLLVALVGANLAMILSGLLGDLATDPWPQYLFFGLGALGLLAILALIYGPLRAVARRQPHRLYRAYREAALLLGGLWLGYPVIWLLGPSGVGMLGGTADTALFVLLSIASKVGWGALDLARLRELGARGELPLGGSP